MTTTTTTLTDDARELLDYLFTEPAAWWRSVLDLVVTYDGVYCHAYTAASVNAFAEDDRLEALRALDADEDSDYRSYDAWCEALEPVTDEDAALEVYRALEVRICGDGVCAEVPIRVEVDAAMLGDEWTDGDDLKRFCEILSECADVNAVPVTDSHDGARNLFDEEALIGDAWNEALMLYGDERAADAEDRA